MTKPAEARPVTLINIALNWTDEVKRCATDSSVNNR